MIQLETFAAAKAMARLPLGAAASQAFLYWSDIRRQWEGGHDQTKALGLIGSQGLPLTALCDVRDRLGALDPAEAALAAAMRQAYGGAARSLTSLETRFDPEADIAETLLDFRLLAGHVRFPCRVLDIGPGAGRHMLGLFLDPERRGGVYAGVESIGLPYLLQNLLASWLRGREGAGEGPAFHEQIDYQFARRPFPADASGPGTLLHLPLWAADQLPSGGFDLVLCSYLLDEVSNDDFVRILDLIDHALAPGGVVYCRGSQHRAGIRDLYEFGYGTFHQHDITASLRARGLRPFAGALEASILTRLFRRGAEDAAGGAAGDAAGDADDALLAAPDDATALSVAQERLVAENLAEIKARGLKVVVWDKLSCRSFRHFIEPYAVGLDIVAFTNDMATGTKPTDFGVPEVPLSDLKALAPDVVVVCSHGELHPMRCLSGALGIEALPRWRRVAGPVAFAYLHERVG